MCDCQDVIGENNTCLNCSIMDNIEMDYYLSADQEQIIFDLILYKEKYTIESIQNKLINDCGFFVTISKDISEIIKPIKSNKKRF